MATQTIPSSVEPAYLRFVLAAYNAGVPQDSLERFHDAGYIPQPKQLQFHAACRLCDAEDGPDEIGFGGARGPGKSHAVFAQIALDDCQRVAGLKVLYIRKIAKNAREQFEDLRRSILRYVEHKYDRTTGTITFQDGSRIIIGHFRTEGDIDQYLGMEYDVIAVEEATTLTTSKYKTLRDSNRTSKQDFRPRIYTTTNPGNVGHAFYKERFIAPHRRGGHVAPLDQQTGYTRFVPATVDDNAFIDSGYKRKLEENVGWKLRAYRYGDWDIAAGQYFTNWRHESHVIKPIWLNEQGKVRIPTNCRKWCALDYGFTHPTAVYLMAEHDGIIYAVDEHVEQKRLPSQHASSIKAMLERNGLTVAQLDGFVAGEDVFAFGKDEKAKTIADQYESEGIKLARAIDDRVNGWGRILELLGDVDHKIMPRVQIFDRCVKLIECLPMLQHNPNRPEDVLKVDIDEDGNGGDDAADAFRYGVMFVQPQPARARSFRI